ncbi:MAG: restriction endonuclease subunit S, partial [Finegoldia magna]|nr:restriction endonuclease subunit S [Finegoldia magna]
MSRLEELIQELCPNGVEYKPLSDKTLFAFRYGKGNKIPEDTGGQYDVYGANGIVSHIDEYNCEDVTIIGHIGAVGLINRVKGKCFVTYNGTIATVVDKEKVDSQYLYYVLTTLDLPSRKKGSQPFLSVSDFDKIAIPVPPLEVQREIVRILDSFTLLTAELTAELTARKKQYQHYLNSFFENQTDNLVPLSSLGTITRGKRFVHADATETGVPCIHYGELYTFYGVHANTVKSHIREELRPKMRYAHKGDVIIVGAGENNIDIGVGVAWEGNEDVAVHDACYTLCHSQNSKYISYYLRSDMYHNQIKKYVSEGKICSISATGLGKALIP